MVEHVTAEVKRKPAAYLGPVALLAVSAIGVTIMAIIPITRRLAVFALILSLALVAGVAVSTPKMVLSARLDADGLEVRYPGRTIRIPLGAVTEVRLRHFPHNKAPDGGRTRSINFKVEGQPRVQITDVEFTGLDALMDAIVEHRAEQVLDERERP